jgi:hypothetical protein
MKQKRKYTPRKRPSRDFLRESGKTIAELKDIINNARSLRQAAKQLNTSRDSLLKFIRKYKITHPKERRVRDKRIHALLERLNNLPNLTTLNIFLNGSKRIHTKALKKYRLDLTQDLKYVILTARLSTGKDYMDKYEVEKFLDYFKGVK